MHINHRKKKTAAKILAAIMSIMLAVTPAGSIPAADTPSEAATETVPTPAAETPSPTETPLATETPSPAQTPAVTEEAAGNSLTETPSPTETPAPTEEPKHSVNGYPGHSADSMCYGEYSGIAYDRIDAAVSGMPGTVDAYLDGNEDSSEVGTSWELTDTSQDGYTLTYEASAFRDRNYIPDSGVGIPYCTVTLSKTVTGFYDSTDSAYASYNTDYKGKESVPSGFPQELKAYINGKSDPETIPVTWTCSSYLTENSRQYTFSAEPADGYSFADGIKTPYITVNLTQTITEFLGNDNSKPFSETYITYSEESKATDGFPSEMYFVINNDTSNQMHIPAEWKLTDTQTGADEKVLTYTLQIPDGYECGEGLKAPYILVHLNDGNVILQYAAEYTESDDSTSYIRYTGADDWKKVTAHTGEQEDPSKLLPETFLAHTNLGAWTKVQATWKCTSGTYDYLKAGTYTFEASVPSLRNASGMVFPKVTVTLTDEKVTGFLDFAAGTPYKKLSENYAQKASFPDSLPKQVGLYLGGKTDSAVLVNAEWTCDGNPASDDAAVFTYYLKLPAGYEYGTELGESVKEDRTNAPYIVCTVADYYTMSPESASYSYSGAVQTYKAPKSGRYTVKVWGADADGGTDFSAGGYSYGYINLDKGQTLYVVCGGRGTYGSGGFNGGGAASGGSGGGGATHIATALEGNGLLSAYSGNRSEVAIVAGGSGGIASGGEKFLSVGAGGGLTGQEVSTSDGVLRAAGGTQNSGYAFGIGQPGNGGGGGGWYGGFASNDGTFGGAGGSGYIGGVYGQDMADASGNPRAGSKTGTGAGGNCGNGRAEIAYDGSVETTLTVNTNSGGTWNGQSGNVLVTAKAGTTADLPDPAAYDGFEFVGWKTVSGNGKIDYDGKKFTFGTEDTEIKAVWHRPLYLTGVTDITGNGAVNLSWSQDNLDGSTVYKLYQKKDGGAAQMIDSDGTAATLPSTVSVGGNGASASMYQYRIPVSGVYRLTASGGKGGNDGGIGGYGGSAVGDFMLQKGTVLYVSVGGLGDNSYTAQNGGFNGGARPGNAGASGGGGGATHIATSYCGPYLWQYSGNINSLLLVGGGGGGANNFNEWNNGLPGGIGGDAAFGYGYQPGGDGGGGGGGFHGGQGGQDNSRKASGGSNWVNTGRSTGFYYTLNGNVAGNGYFILQPKNVYPVITGNGIKVYTPDTAAPTVPADAYVSDTDGKNTIVSWTASSDNGNTYEHYLTSCSAADVTKNYDTSNTVKNYVETGVKGYYWYIDGNTTGTAGAGNSFTSDTHISMLKTLSKQYLHVAAVDGAGNIGSTLNYEIPILYFIQYNSNTVSDGGKNGNGVSAETVTKDSRVFAFGTKYTLMSRKDLGAGFEKTGVGYYGQKINYLFSGWGLMNYSPYTGNKTYTAETLNRLNDKPDGYMIGTPQRLNPAEAASPKKQPYLYDSDEFWNLTTTNLFTVNLYAEWIAENQRPYCGFRFMSETHNSDGTGTGTLTEIPYDSYDGTQWKDTEDTATVYDDTVLYAEGSSADPENCGTDATEYQYSEDGGNTWYRLDGNSAPKTFAVTVRKTSSGASLVGMQFTPGKTVLIRMRVRDKVKYVSTYSTKYGTKVKCQVSLWSTGYYYSPDISASDYNAGGLYAGDRGTEVPGGGSWYVKTVNCYKGNLAPESGLVASDTDADRTAQNYAELAGKTEAERYSVLPMYNFTEKGGDTSYLYSRGTLYVLLSSAENRALGGGTDAQLAEAWNRAHGNINSALYSGITFIKEGDARYTEYAPEDETAAYLDASSDPDAGKHTGKVQTPTWNYDKDWAGSYANTGSTEGHAQFAEYFVAVCRRDTFTDVTLSGSDRNTTYGTDGRATSGTLYTRPYTDASGKTRTVKGHIFQTYDEMVKYIRTSGADLFPADTDSTVTAYDIYYAVCDKSWNRISPNAWGAVKHYTELSEPWGAFGDVTFSDAKAANPLYETPVTVYRDGSGKAYTHIASYTEQTGAWRNVFTSVQKAKYTEAAARNINMQSDYTKLSGKDWVTDNGTVKEKAGVFLDLAFSLHGAETYSLVMLKNGGTPESLLYAEDAGFAENGGVLTRGTAGNGKSTVTRKSADAGKYWLTQTASVGFPEQTPDGTSYVLQFTLGKIPYTGNGTEETRTVKIGEAAHPFITLGSSELSDNGVQNTD